MKKMFKYASLSAIAFVGAVSFSACSSSDEVVENNPNFDPETNKVKTEFVINVTQPGERTRMTAANAGAGTFQGLNNMQLICFTDVPGTDNAFETDDKLTLTPYTGPSVSGDDTNNSSKVYTLYIPNETNNFLFYATTYGSVGANDKFTYGSLVNNLSSASTVVTTTPATTDIMFNLEPIASSAEIVTTPQTTLLGVLNGIAGAAYENNTPSDATDDITWASTISKTGVQWQALKNAFEQFTHQAAGGDVRQGSSAAILSMVSDLFDAVNDVYTSESDTDVKGVATAVLEKIKVYFNVTLSGTTYTWESRAYNSGYSVNYPEGQHLPTGSAVLTYNSGAFSYLNNGTMGSGTATVSTAYNNFTYPSELTYYCNSGLWQSTTAKKVGDYPTTSLTWLSYDWNTNGWNGNAVSSATRAVAMKDNITYGAAQLISKVQLGDGVGTATAPLVDNAAAINTSATVNNSFDGSTTEKTINLKVHALLIGGQPDAARYDYLPQEDKFSNVVYDLFSSEGTAVSTTAWTTPNYTLVLDNHVATGDQSTVNVALEMTADKEFYGASGKIKAGQKFYLIGSLKPESLVTGSSITWDDHKSFKTGDRGQGADRVFIRDATTTATFTLGANCLQSAYSTIPDLRSTQMVFGISVDLVWKAGLSYNVNIGQ